MVLELPRGRVVALRLELAELNKPPNIVAVEGLGRR